MKKLLLLALALLCGLGIWFGLNALLSHRAASALPDLPDLSKKPAGMKDYLEGKDAAARQNPGADDVVGALGMAYHANLYYDRAGACYAIAASLDPEDWRWPYLTALVAEERGAARTGLRLLRRVVQRVDLPLAWYRLGRAAQKAGEMHAAREAFRRVLALSAARDEARRQPSPGSRTFPVRAYAAYSLAHLELKHGSVEEAERLLSEVVEHNPRFGPAHRLLGRVYDSLGRSEEASVQRGKAAGLPPFYPPADPLVDELARLSHAPSFLLKQLNLARQSANPSWAEYLARRAIEVDPEYPDAVAALGLLLLDLHRFGEALDYFDRYCELKPTDFQTLNNIGAFLGRYGRLKEAARHYRVALGVNPDCAEAHSNLGMILSMQGDQQRAMKHLEQARELQPRNAEVLTNLGTVAARLHDYERSRRHYHEALKADPRFTAAHYGLGVLQSALGRYEEAMQHFEQALETRPDDHNTAERMAWLLATCPDEKIRDGERAVGLAARAIEVEAGGDLRFAHTLSAAYAEAGRFDEAKETLEKAIAEAREKGRDKLAARFEESLSMYERGQPLRQAAKSH